MSANPSAALAQLREKLQAFVGKETGPPVEGIDPVNEPMIRHWCEALENGNPVYTNPKAAADSVHGGIVAPPTMLQAWILPGMELARPAADRKKDLQQELHQLLSQAGYPGVVATNCDQEYFRYLRPGDRVSATTVIEAISDEKATALGIGFFIDTRTVFRDQHGEAAGEMLFRVLKFKTEARPQATAPDAAPAKPKRLRPVIGHDNAWWWDGIKRGELLIQRCKDCGTLRHPPRPMCGQCQSTQWDAAAASGKGTVYSFVVYHHPQFPGYEYPLLAAVVELEEGTRIVSNLAGVEPADVHIGMAVRVSIEAVDEDLKLPLFRPVS